MFTAGYTGKRPIRDLCLLIVCPSQSRELLNVRYPRQTDCHRCPHAFLTLYVQLAAMQIDELSDNGQPQPYSTNPNHHSATP